MHQYQDEMNVAMEAARQAGAGILEDYKILVANPNAPADITTKTDKSAQDTILTCIQNKYPDDALSAEEATQILLDAKHQGDRLWIVDPIDGTRGFARKNDEFSVMIGFVAHGVIQLGVVLEPALDRLTYAMLGEGCWWTQHGSEPKRCHCNPTEQISQATLSQSHAKSAPRESWGARTLGVANVIQSYSAGVKLAHVARGDADIYLNTYTAFRDWDICAGHILVTEAGGRVTGINNEELRYGEAGAWQRHGLLATNGKLHSEAVRLLNPQK